MTWSRVPSIPAMKKLKSRFDAREHSITKVIVAMGKVVDAEGQVRGVKGLRVADASIVPIPLGGHPQAT